MTTESILTWVKSHSEEETLSLIASGEELYFQAEKASATAPMVLAAIQTAYVFCGAERDRRREVSLEAYYEMHSKDRDGFGDFVRDDSDTLRLLFVVDMLTEGVHMDDLDGVFMIRPTESIRIYFQQLGRALAVTTKREHPIILDIVSNAGVMRDGLDFFAGIGKEMGMEEDELEKFFQDTVTTSVSGRQQTYLIPQQTHGAHTLRMYFEATVNGNLVRSNELFYEIILYRISESTPIIASSYNAFTVMQFTTVNIPYTVYTQGSQMSEVVIRAGSKLVSEITVDRSRQTLSYRFNNAGAQTITITTGSVTKTMNFTVTAADIDVHAETENLALYLSSGARSNNEANPGVWTFGTGEDEIACTFTNFNFKSDGWILDDDGITALRVTGDARLSIPYKPFAQDFRATGKTIEIEFAARDVLNYDAVILSCLNQGRGISMTAQSCLLTSEQSSISMQFKRRKERRGIHKKFSLCFPLKSWLIA